MIEETKRLQVHLDRVSRSFAYCIKQLPQPFRNEVSLAYLLFRLLDTVEDAAWSVDAKQQIAFDALESFLACRPSLASVETWKRSFPEGLADGDRKLVDDGAWIVEEFWKLEREKREVLHRHFLNAARGMRHFVLRTQEGTRLGSLEEVNTYCFFVAGVVGEYLSEGYALHESSYDWRAHRLEAYHFGMFLQKVNILKDQLDDQKAGREFVPNRLDLLQSLKVHSDHAFQYILSLPRPRDAYALFCAWSFFLGLASLPFIEKRWQLQDPTIKISRFETLDLLFRVRWSLRRGEALTLLYSEKRKFLDSFPNTVITTNVRNDGARNARKCLTEFYQGVLSYEDFRQLNLALKI